MTFKLENNVPEYYTERSRDFQLLCRVLNIFLAASMEKAAQIANSWEVESLDEKFLSLMLRRLGCTERSYFPPKILRNLCKGYPSILRWKGTERALRELAYAIFSSDQLVSRLDITADARLDSYRWAVVSNSTAIDNEIYFKKLLPYILPAGVEVGTVLNITSQHSPITKLTPVSSVYRIRHNLAATSTVVSGENSGTLVEGNWSEALSNVSESEGLNVVYSKVGVGTVAGSFDMDSTRKTVKDPSIVVNKDSSSN